MVAVGLPFAHVCRYGFLFLAVIFPIFAHAEDQGDPLVRLTTAVKELCQRPPIEFRKDKIDASADAKAKAGNILTRILTDAGVTLKGDFERVASSGVVPEQLADAIKDGNQCVVKTLETLRPLVEGKNSSSVEPSFAVTFKGDDILLVNNGAPEENLAIKYVALAWSWIYNEPRDKGCDENGPMNATEAVAVKVFGGTSSGGTSSDGVIRSSGVVHGIRTLPRLIPSVTKWGPVHSCSYELQYSIALSYDDREGRQQRRFYEVDWRALRGSPEMRRCRKVNEEAFNRSVANYQDAVRSGGAWDLNINVPAALESFVSLMTQRRYTELRLDLYLTGETAKEIDRILGDIGSPPRPCTG